MVQNPTEGHYLICHFSILFLNFSSCLKIAIYETHLFRTNNEVHAYNLSVRLEAGKEVCREIPTIPPPPSTEKKISSYKIF